jgi:proline iminopeptidase
MHRFFARYSSVWFTLLLCSVIGCTSSKMLRHGALEADRSLYFQHIGQGEPIVVVHGGPGLNHRYLFAGLEPLAKNYHLIFYDQRGSGDSQVPTDTNKMRMDQFVRDIDLLKEKFRLKKFHLLAHSFGSHIAIRYAAAHPGSLKSLILLSPAGISSEDTKEAGKILGARFDYTDQVKRSRIIDSKEFKENHPEAFQKLMSLTFSRNMAKPELADSLDIYYPPDFNQKNQALRYLFKDLQSYDLYPLIPAIQSPVLIIGGQRDAGYFVIEKIRNSRPGTQVYEIPDCGHFPFLETPQPFLSAVRLFLDSNP